MGEESETLEEVHEPFLIQEGYLQRTPQGRVLTEKGYAAVGLKPAGGRPASSQARPVTPLGFTLIVLGISYVAGLLGSLVAWAAGLSSYRP